MVGDPLEAARAERQRVGEEEEEEEQVPAGEHRLRPRVPGRRRAPREARPRQPRAHAVQQSRRVRGQRRGDRRSELADRGRRGAPVLVAVLRGQDDRRPAEALLQGDELVPQARVQPVHRQRGGPRADGEADGRHRQRQGGGGQVPRQHRVRQRVPRVRLALRPPPLVLQQDARRVRGEGEPDRAGGLVLPLRPPGDGVAAEIREAREGPARVGRPPRLAPQEHGVRLLLHRQEGPEAHARHARLQAGDRGPRLRDRAPAHQDVRGHHAPPHPQHLLEPRREDADLRGAREAGEAQGGGRGRRLDGVPPGPPEEAARAADEGGDRGGVRGGVRAQHLL
mmetsp:Transcript_26420/g.63751  ORF Transcript_26420/g.63751 Transcript_26420/m.63751 type:complete len:338 (-) Transcript_26420:5363-6376(-)